MLLIIVPGLSFEVAARGTVGYRQRMAAATAKILRMSGRKFCALAVMPVAIRRT